MKVSLSYLLASPHLYPMNIDFQKRLVSFVPVSRYGYRASSFLDDRTVRINSSLYTVDLDELLSYNEAHSEPPKVTHYIFHGAFCCSTLLARILELVPGNFVLKEPTSLTQLAAVRRRIPNFDGPTLCEQEDEEWLRILGFVLRLLGRTYNEGDSVTIKACDLCNALGEVLLTHNSKSKILFLSITMRTFLLSTLKNPGRREWLRARLSFAKHDAAMFPELREIEPTVLSDAEAGAYLWLLNHAISRRLRTGPYSARVLMLDGERIAEKSSEALRTVSDFLGLRLEEARFIEMLTHPSISRYSKCLSRAYSSNSRREELAALENQFGKEADKGMEWASNLHSETGSARPAELRRRWSHRKLAQERRQTPAQ